MRALVRRASWLIALSLTSAASQAAPAFAQAAPAVRAPQVVVWPEIRTRIEGLMAAPGVPIAADYYRIDTRFGPGLRVDALIVEAIDGPQKARGLRVQVRDDGNRNRQEGTSYLDLDEVVSLTRALTPMADLASKWTGQDERRAMDLTFTSAGGFRLAIREFGRVQRIYLSTGLVDPVATTIEMSDLSTLTHTFEQALTILREK